MLARFGVDRLGWRQLVWERFGEQIVHNDDKRPIEPRAYESQIEDARILQYVNRKSREQKGEPADRLKQAERG